MARPKPQFLARLILFLPILVAGFFLASCGGDDGSSRVTIRYARWGLPEEIEAERQLLKDFEAAHPGIRVNVEFASWSEYWNKLQAQMAAGTAPDVFLIGGTHLHDYQARGQLVNIQPYIQQDPDFDLNSYFGKTVEVFEFDDGLWAMPRDCNTIAIYYNKALFDKHGVEYPQPGWTWEDFIEKARALTEDENGDGRMESYGYLASFESMEVHWVSWVWQNEGHVLDGARRKSLIGEPEAVEALEFFSGLVLQEDVSPGTAQASTFGSNMFLTGRLAMSSEGSWMLRLFSEIKGFEWDVAPLPKGKINVAPVNGLGNAVYSGSKNKEAAWELVKFLSSRPYQERLAQSGTSIPALKEVAYSPVYLDDTPPGKPYFLEQIENGRTLPFTRGFARWEDAIRGELELVWLGRKDVPEAMKDASAKVDAILAEQGETE